MSELNSGINLYKQFDIDQNADFSAIQAQLDKFSSQPGLDSETSNLLPVAQRILLDPTKRQMYDDALNDASSSAITNEDLNQPVCIAAS